MEDIIVKIILLLFALIYILDKKCLEDYTLLFIMVLAADRANLRYVCVLGMLYIFHILMTLSTNILFIK